MVDLLLSLRPYCCWYMCCCGLPAVFGVSAFAGVDIASVSAVAGVPDIASISVLAGVPGIASASAVAGVPDGALMVTTQTNKLSEHY